MINKKHLKLIIIVTICGISAWGVFYAVDYFTPRNVTEAVKIVQKDERGCKVQTMDKFIIRIGPCLGDVGDTITVTYDEKKKERFREWAP